MCLWNLHRAVLSQAGRNILPVQSLGVHNVLLQSHAMYFTGFTLKKVFQLKIIQHHKPAPATEVLLPWPPGCRWVWKLLFSLFCGWRWWCRPLPFISLNRSDWWVCGVAQHDCSACFGCCWAGRRWVSLEHGADKERQRCRWQGPAISR